MWLRKNDWTLPRAQLVCALTCKGGDAVQLSSTIISGSQSWMRGGITSCACGAVWFQNSTLVSFAPAHAEECAFVVHTISCRPTPHGAGHCAQESSGNCQFQFHDSEIVRCITWRVGRFCSELQGWIVGKAGIVLSTSNGGVDWQAERHVQSCESNPLGGCIPEGVNWNSVEVRDRQRRFFIRHFKHGKKYSPEFEVWYADHPNWVAPLHETLEPKGRMHVKLDLIVCNFVGFKDADYIIRRIHVHTWNQ